MHARAEKTGQPKTAANPAKSGGASAAMSARPETRAVEEMQERADASPGVQRLSAMQRRADASPRANDLAQLQAVADGGVAQRVVKIKAGSKVIRFGTFKAFTGSPIYRDLMSELEARQVPEERAMFHLRQMFSGDVDFEDVDHFKQALLYDIETKSVGGEPHTLQEQYLTEYGWKRRALAEPSASASGAGPSEPPQLKVYRTMFLTDYEALMENPAALTGHLGDFKQAQNYLFRDRKSPGAKPKVLVEFRLKPGAERHLFSPAAMAFPAAKHKRKVPDMMRQTLIKEGASDAFGEANPNEGTARDLVGIKAEAGGEAGFSLGIGGGSSAELFMSMVESMHIVGRSHPEADEEEQKEGGSGSYEEREEMRELGVGVGVGAASSSVHAAEEEVAAHEEPGAMRLLPQELLYAHAAGFPQPGDLMEWRTTEAFQAFRALASAGPISAEQRDVWLGEYKAG